MKVFKEKLSNVPNKPGSYQMKNKEGVIIYVGKAKIYKKDLEVILLELLLVRLNYWLMI